VRFEKQMKMFTEKGYYIDNQYEPEEEKKKN
jgi:hypothetical protein